MKVPMRILGGPEDGGTVNMSTTGVYSHYTYAGLLTWPATDDEPERTGTKEYHYLSDPRRRVVVFQGEEVLMHETPEGGEGTVGFKKHGTGQIVESDAEQADLSKTASQSWSENDEQGLTDEDKS